MTRWESQKAHPKTLPGAGIQPIKGQATPKVQLFVLVCAPSGVYAAKQRKVQQQLVSVLVHFMRGHVNICPA